jgi:hypothetical protein
MHERGGETRITVQLTVISDSHPVNDDSNESGPSNS